MRLRRRLSSSLRPLFTHRLRTVLALSGVSIGAAAVVVAGAIGEGAREEVERSMQRMGTNLILIKPLPVKRSVFRPGISGVGTRLDLDDCADLSRMPEVRELAPAVEGALRVKAGPTAMKTTVRGTTTSYLSIRGFELSQGRFFGGEDLRALRRVAVLGSRVAEELFGGDMPIGAELRIRGVPFEIIGTLRSKGSTPDSADQDNQILIPLSTALRRVFNEHWLTSVYVSVVEGSQMTAAEEQIRRVFRERHSRFASDGEMGVQNTAKARAIQQELMESLSRYAGGLGGLALGLGGLGVLALMVLSVRERTSEIGLRMALGAQPRDILWQILLESSLLALAGWFAGVLAGSAGIAGVAFLAGWPVGVPWSALGASLLVAVVTGVGFGAFPARKAARIPPIQALLRR